ncbi:MAG TPA: calcium-translocating P-type ATPase, PMCA-type [Epulopiscium sp.]|nr:calcium-translocating P-type ATPase, PMCA-type [Candidatus Epulonipiscium sp.]
MKFFAEEANNVLGALDVEIDKGLTDEQVSARIEEYGENEFSKHIGTSLWDELREAVSEQMMVILLIASGISLVVGEYQDGLGILIAVSIGIIIGLVTEGRSKKAAEALAKMTEDIETKAIRNGQVIEIHKSKLVPGDIIMLEMGDMVPADGRLIESYDLKVREDMLTGEADEAKKQDVIVGMEIIQSDKGEIVQDPIPAKQTNMLFAGTLISYGRGKIVVTATGDHTEMGRIAKSLTQKSVDTPLQIKLGKLGAGISKISTFIAALLFVYMTGNMIADRTLRISFTGFRNFLLSIQPLNNVFIVCVALIVAAVPEGLPTMVNMTLAITMQKMAKINALVTKKEACETIGSISVICSDKTGTLTQNKMKVEKVYMGGKFIEDERLQEGKLDNGGYFIDNCIINATADIQKENGNYHYLGSATECALLLLHEKVNYRARRQQNKIVTQTPFTSDRKRMSTIIEAEKDYVLLIKGAPEIILDMCGYEYLNGIVMRCSKRRKQSIFTKIKGLQEQAMRTMAFAYRVLPKTVDIHRDTRLEEDLVFAGFVGIQDPLRPGVKEAIQTAKGAGIVTKILTGDNIYTAIAIGQQLGIVNERERAVEASYIDQLSDYELEKEINYISIVARSKPETKMRIVQALQRGGEVVAVTGDGINDAPALTMADVGIAMGIAGTEVSKSAADIILVDDSFGTIIQSVKWGRGIYRNFQRFIQFQITVNIIAFLIAIISQIGDYQMPFTTIQLLWVNIIMDGPPALALGLEPVRSSVLRKKPISKTASIITRSMLFNMLSNALYITTLIYLQMRFNILGARVDNNEMQTVLFSIFAMCALMNAFNCREFGTKSIFPNFKNNKIAIQVILGTMILQVILTETCKGFFNAVSLSTFMWVKIILLSTSVIAVSELVKLVKYLNKNKNWRDLMKFTSKIRIKNTF